MFFTHGNEWIVSLTIAVILELYTSVRFRRKKLRSSSYIDLAKSGFIDVWMAENIIAFSLICKNFSEVF